MSTRSVKRTARRCGEDEARLVDQLRDGGFARLSLVAVLNDHVIGHVLFSDLPIATSRGDNPLVNPGPAGRFARLPETWDRLDACSRRFADGGRARHRSVIVLGDATFYVRFGFSLELAVPLSVALFGAPFLGGSIEAGASAPDGVEGDVCYPPPFSSL